MKQKIYIAGKITGLEKEVYSKAFEDAEKLIITMGHTPINPIKIVPQELSYDDQMHLCLALVDISDAVMMLDNWVDSPGATRELVHGAKQEKKILYYDEQREIHESISKVWEGIDRRCQQIVDKVISGDGDKTPVGIVESMKKDQKRVLIVGSGSPSLKHYLLGYEVGKAMDEGFKEAFPTPPAFNNTKLNINDLGKELSKGFDILGRTSPNSIWITSNPPSPEFVVKMREALEHKIRQSY